MKYLNEAIHTLLHNRPQPWQPSYRKAWEEKSHILITSSYSACAHTMAWEFKSPALCSRKWNFCNKDSSVSQNIKFLGQIKNQPSSRTAAILAVPLLIFISWYWWLQHLSSQRVCIILFTTNPFSNHTRSEKGGVKTCCVLKRKKNLKIKEMMHCLFSTIDVNRERKGK